MNTPTPVRPNLVATLFHTLTETVQPLLDTDNPPALTDPGIEDLATHLSATLTAALRATRPSPAVSRPATTTRTTPRTVTQVGPTAATVKPGTLRAKLADYLATHPGQAFTVTELTHATDAASGGAVGAALNTMTAHGEALLAGDSPKRYTAPAAPTTAPAPAEPETDDHLDEPTADITEDATETPQEATPTPEVAARATTDDESPTGHRAAPDTETVEPTEQRAATAPAEGASRARTKRR